MNKRLIALVGLFLSTIIASSELWSMVQSVPQGLEVHTIYGSTIIEEPVLIAVLRHPAFERLKHIKQYGVFHYMQDAPAYSYSRYEHSLGVFYIVRTFGAHLDEQIASLLHDVSHTVFSHVGDMFFKAHIDTSHQDSIHQWYLQRSGLAAILEMYGFGRVVALSKESWPMLYQKHPQLCADRIEYNIKGALLEGHITEEDASELLANLSYTDSRWCFTSKKAAQTFAYAALKLCETIWSADWNLFMYHEASRVLHRAVALGILTEDDIHFSTDDAVWQKVCSSNDEYIKRGVRIIQTPRAWFRCVTASEAFDLRARERFRGVDPLVMTAESTYPLSALDEAFSSEFDRIKAIAQEGYYFKYRMET